MTPVEADHIRRVYNQARSMGRDPIEWMDRRGLLHTAYRAAQVEADALFQAAQELENMDVDQIGGVRRISGRVIRTRTPFEMRRAVVVLLRNMARKKVSDASR